MTDTVLSVRVTTAAAAAAAEPIGGTAVVGLLTATAAVAAAKRLAAAVDVAAVAPLLGLLLLLASVEVGLTTGAAALPDANTRPSAEFMPGALIFIEPGEGVRVTVVVGDPRRSTAFGLEDVTLLRTAGIAPSVRGRAATTTELHQDGSGEVREPVDVARAVGESSRGLLELLAVAPTAAFGAAVAGSRAVGDRPRRSCVRVMRTTGGVPLRDGAETAGDDGGFEPSKGSFECARWLAGRSVEATKSDVWLGELGRTRATGLFACGDGVRAPPDTKERGVTPAPAARGVTERGRDESCGSCAKGSED